MFIAGENQNIYKSEDLGVTWETIDTPIPVRNEVGNLYFYNENIGFLDGIANVYRTADGGLN